MRLFAVRGLKPIVIRSAVFRMCIYSTSPLNLWQTLRCRRHLSNVDATQDTMWHPQADHHLRS